MKLEKWVTVSLLIYFGSYLFLTGTIYLDFWESDEIFNARTIPYLIGSVGLLYVIGLLWNLTRQKHISTGIISAVDNRAFWLIAGVVLYISLLESLGFIPSSLLLLALSAYFLGERRIGLIVSTAILVPVSLWAILTFLGIYLPPGNWGLTIQGLSP